MTEYRKGFEDGFDTAWALTEKYLAEEVVIKPVRDLFEEMEELRRGLRARKAEAILGELGA